jgi:hypothetical protein
MAGLNDEKLMGCAGGAKSTGSSLISTSWKWVSPSSSARARPIILSAKVTLNDM